MFIVVSYDINDNRRRLKIAKRLEDFGTRVQYSVFECILDEIPFKELQKAILPLIKEEDSLRFYNLCEKCLKKIQVFGSAEITKDLQVYII